MNFSENVYFSQSWKHKQEKVLIRSFVFDLLKHYLTFLISLKLGALSTLKKKNFPSRLTLEQNYLRILVFNLFIGTI